MTKPEIIEAAFRVWGRNLYQKTSLSQLARELGVSKPALYRHFVNKHALTTAMTERFFDDFAASIRPDYEQALLAREPNEGIITMIRGISGFYGRNVYAFIFSLINLHERSLDSSDSGDRLKSRGVDMGTLHRIFVQEYAADLEDGTSPVLMQLIFATMTFFMAQFHKSGKSFESPQSDESIQKVIALICKMINGGLGFTSKEIEALDPVALEGRIDKTVCNAEPEPLFRAVAEAVAEAGPWGATMDMVAQRLGFSKSSLYGHFKNRKDMIRRLFTGEFKRIIEFARQGLSQSVVPAEQLYLGIYSIAVYLHSQPDFLAALGWIRTRRLDLGKSEKQNEMFRLFEEVDIEQMKNSGEEERWWMSHWILFLLVKILTQPCAAGNARVTSLHEAQNDIIRSLYRFVTLGLEGFKR